VSLEFTGELNDEGFSVTECVGGSMELDEGQLGLRYQVGLNLWLCRQIFLVFSSCLLIYFIPNPVVRPFVYMLYLQPDELVLIFHPFFYSLSAIRD
jgi:hypothetical protein